MHRSSIPLIALACLSPGLLQAEDLAEHVNKALPPHVGAAVLVVDGGQAILKRGYGVRRLGEPEPVTPSTNFRLASITKHMTATAVMLLVEEGRIELDHTLDRYFPGCPDYWADITIHQLLCHTSGVPAYESLIPEGTTLQLDDTDCLEVLFDTSAPLFEPGTDYRYSNSGYVLLGLVVQQANDQPFHRFLRMSVFEPAGMANTLAYVKGFNQVEERAYGHRRIGGGWEVADQSLTSAMLGDGGVYSSLDDLQRWLAVLDARRLLASESYDAMLTPHTADTDNTQTHYGYGWRLDRSAGWLRVSHNGGTRGFSHTFQRDPERGRAVLVLLNSESKEPMTEVGRRVWTIAFGPD